MIKKIFFAISFFLFSVPAFAISTNDNRIETRVLSVYDGDTFTVEINGKKEKIRVLGIDTPEKNKSSKPMCRGKIVAKFAEKLLKNKKVVLYRDQKSKNRGFFGRLLRVVKINDRLDYGFFMILLGNAKVYENKDFSKKDFYEKFQEKAQKKHRGIWSKKCVTDYPIEKKQKPKKKFIKKMPNKDQNVPVKKSNSGICHDQNSSFYSRTKFFEPFETIEKCLKSGGKLPKN